MLGIVDYNAGNIRSVARALEKLGVPHIISKKPSELGGCNRLIFPGVGEASYAMSQLQKTGLDSFIKDWALSGKPLLGICLGSQIIFDFSEEGNVECLGLLHGTVRSLSDLWREKEIDKESLKVPHMGWNDIHLENGGSPLLNGVSFKADFYFVHSFVICPLEDEIVKACADYGIRIPSFVEKDNIAACQFHPEKSGFEGFKILRNFCGLKEGSDA